VHADASRATHEMRSKSNILKSKQRLKTRNNWMEIFLFHRWRGEGGRDDYVFIILNGRCKYDFNLILKLFLFWVNCSITRLFRYFRESSNKTVKYQWSQVWNLIWQSEFSLFWFLLPPWWDYSTNVTTPCRSWGNPRGEVSWSDKQMTSYSEGMGCRLGCKQVKATLQIGKFSQAHPHW
jgi:hypothetical protein